jgi:uncharacterized OB-fold protein
MATQVPIVDYLVLDGTPHLTAHECTKCGALYFDRRNACASCSNREYGTRALGNDGVVRSFTIVHRAAPGVPAPFASAVVDLDGGGKVKGNIVGVEPTPDNISLGMPVRLTTFVVGTDDHGTEAVAFGFEPTGGKR